MRLIIVATLDHLFVFAWICLIHLQYVNLSGFILVTDDTHKCIQTHEEICLISAHIWIHSDAHAVVTNQIYKSSVPWFSTLPCRFV